jgi:hypothetical protein
MAPVTHCLVSMTFRVPVADPAVAVGAVGAAIGVARRCADVTPVEIVSVNHSAPEAMAAGLFGLPVAPGMGDIIERMTVAAEKQVAQMERQGKAGEDWKAGDDS